MLTIEPPPLFDHVTAEDLAGLENTAEINRQNAVPIGVRGVEKIRARVYARAVHKDVHLAGQVDGLGQHVFDGLARGHVNQAIIGFAAEFFQLRDAGFARVVEHVGDNQSGPGLGQTGAQGSPQHPGPANNHCRLPGEPEKTFKIF